MNTTDEAINIIQALLNALDYGDDYAQNKDGFTIFNNDSVDAYHEATQFIIKNKRANDE